MRIIVALAVGVVLQGCIHPSDEEIIVHNHSDSVVYVYHTCSDSLEQHSGLMLFETYKIKSNGKTITYAPYYRITEYDTGSIPTELIKKTLISSPRITCSDDSLRLFFISEATMRTKSWNEIYDGQIYERKVMVSEQEVRKDNWKVVYQSD